MPKIIWDFKDTGEIAIFDDFEPREHNTLGQCASDNFSSNQRKFQITESFHVIMILKTISL